MSVTGLRGSAGRFRPCPDHTGADSKWGIDMRRNAIGKRRARLLGPLVLLLTLGLVAACSGAVARTPNPSRTPVPRSGAGAHGAGGRDVRRRLSVRARPGHEHHRRREHLPDEAIYGGLFLLEADDDGSNARVVPNQAEGYELQRRRARPSRSSCARASSSRDGTPLDAEAVACNFQRAIDSAVHVRTDMAAGRGRTPSPPPDPLHGRRSGSRSPDAAVVNSFPVEQHQLDRLAHGAAEDGRGAVQDQAGGRRPVHGA